MIALYLGMKNQKKNPLNDSQDMTELLVLFAGIDIPDSRKMENNSKQQKTKQKNNEMENAPFKQ